MKSTPPKDALATARSRLEEHGHLVIAVLPDAKRGVPGWSYTVGLAAHALPELFVIGLPHELAKMLCNNLAHRLRAAGGAQPLDLTGLVNVALRPRHAAPDGYLPHMNTLAALNQPVPAEILQILWPDTDGHFPGEPGYRCAISQSPYDLIPSRSH